MKKFYSLLCAATLTFGVGMYATNADAGKPVDSDGDGHKSNVDCNDNDPTVWDLNTCGECAPEPAGGCGGTPEICTNGIDDDGDTLIDCADTADCSTDPTCQTSGNGPEWVVMASNDLGMHCACPGAEYFLLLPPFNTLRAQVIHRDVNNLQGGTPTVVADNSIRVEYNIVENTDASLAADPYYQGWLAAAPKLFPGYDPAPGGVITGLAGKGLSGEMDAEPEGWYEAIGIPAFPDVSSNSTSQEKIMTDPLNGPNRNPYLTGNVKVFDSATDELLAETNANVPVAFGGCCGCHLQLTADNGLEPTPLNSFNLMGQLHERDNGINIAQMDPDGDGTPGPIRCSQCHLDPAMGESTPPGYTGYPTSSYTFSDVLHRWHVENSTVLTYDPDLANNCYTCHPGNGVNCYRGHHTNKTVGRKQDQHLVWCSDCHGDLNQRVAENQMAEPWSANTLPGCTECHSNTGENNVLAAFGGSFLRSMAHKSDTILCSTCHGEPHALNPSSFSKDNTQNLSLQNDARAIGVCNVCHVGRSDNWGKPSH